MTKLKALFAVPVLAAASVSAHAALDTTALDGAKADIALVGGIVFAVMIAIACFKYLKKLL
jgi:hypothetical protein